MVLIICTKNESHLTNRYWDMVPDGQKVWTDGQNGRTAPTTSSRDNKNLSGISLASSQDPSGDPWNQIVDFNQDSGWRVVVIIVVVVIIIVVVVIIIIISIPLDTTKEACKGPQTVSYSICLIFDSLWLG